MYSYDIVKNIYDHLQDERSKFIFLKRLEYSLTGRKSAVEEIVKKEMERYGLRDIMNRLLSWIAERAGEIVIFGAGFAGSQINLVLQRHNIEVKCFADNNKQLWHSEKRRVKILSPDVISKDDLVVIGMNSHVAEVYDQLLLMGIKRTNIFLPDKPWWVGDHPQYFAPEIVHPGENEIFVDGGSLDGGDSLNFIRWCGGTYKAICVFEPDEENCKTLSHLMKQCHHVEIFKEGPWNDEEKLHFITGKKENSTISDMGNTTIKVTSIDKKLKERKPTFIKMDIEGSEMEALFGAAETIRKWKPKLAICVYHKSGDILDIPQKILELNSEYKLYLRHYSYVDTETVLYAIKGEADKKNNR